MIVYVPKGMSTKFASCLYEIGRMASNTGKSNTIYTVTDCDHEYKSTNTWYHLDPFSDKVTTQQSITLPSTKYDIQNPIENDNWKLMGVFPESPMPGRERLFVDRKEIPAHYFTDHLVCEHCHKKIKRNYLWLFQSKKDQDAQLDDDHTVHVSKGEFRMVGSSCIEVYTGFKANLIRKIKEMIDEAQALGETEIEYLDTNKFIRTKIEYVGGIFSKKEIFALMVSLLQVYDLDEAKSILKNLLDLPTWSTKPYDLSDYQGIIPISQSSLDTAQEIIDYFNDPSNGEKLERNQEKFDKILHDFEYLDRTIGSSTEYRYDRYDFWYRLTNIFDYWENKPTVDPFTEADIWIKNCKPMEPLPTGTSITVNASDIKAYYSNYIMLESYDLLKLPGYAVFDNADKKFKINYKPADSLTLTVTGVDTEPYRLYTIEDSPFSINRENLKSSVCAITEMDGQPFKAPVVKNNLMPPGNIGDTVSKDIDHTADGGNGWTDIIDNDGYTWVYYGSVPVDAKSFRATYSGHNSYRGSNKGMIKRPQFFFDTIAEMNAKEAEKATASAAAATGPYLGEVGDEVVIDVKSVYKQESNGKYGLFYIYYITDTAGHNIKLLSPKDNIIPANAKLIKATISKLDDYQNKKTTQITSKGLEVLDVKN